MGQFPRFRRHRCDFNLAFLVNFERYFWAAIYSLLAAAPLEGVSISQTTATAIGS